MRLITFGCSLTYGHGLEDCFIPPYDPGPEPSKLAWPQLVANTLGVECFNMSNPGASNKEILYRIQTFDFQKGDVAIVQWSWIDRYCTITDKDEIEQIAPWFDNEQSICYYKHIYSDKNSKIDFYTRANYAKFLFDHKNVKNYHFTVFKDKDQPSWNNVIFEQPSISLIRHNYDLGLDKSHPGPDAHKAFSKMVLNILNVPKVIDNS